MNPLDLRTGRVLTFSPHRLSFMLTMAAFRFVECCLQIKHLSYQTRSIGCLGSRIYEFWKFKFWNSYPNRLLQTQPSKAGHCIMTLSKFYPRGHTISSWWHHVVLFWGHFSSGFLTPICAYIWLPVHLESLFFKCANAELLFSIRLPHGMSLYLDASTTSKASKSPSATDTGGNKHIDTPLSGNSSAKKNLDDDEGARRITFCTHSVPVACVRASH